MKPISSYGRIKVNFIFDLIVLFIFLLSLIFLLNQIGYLFFGVGIIILLIYSIFVYLKNTFYRAIFIDSNNDLYTLKILRFGSKEYEKITITSYEKMFYTRLYKIKVKAEGISKTYYTSSFQTELFPKEIIEKQNK